MEMPNSCIECCFCRGLNACKLKKYLNRDGITTIYTVDKQIMDGTKPFWCPLRPMPENKETSKYMNENEKGFCEGWNAYMDTILRE